MERAPGTSQSFCELRDRGAQLVAPTSLVAPDLITITAHVAPNAQEGERTGWIVLRRDGEVRRIPFWFRVTNPRLPAVEAPLLDAPGTYAASTSGANALVRTYRYPEGTGNTRRVLRGPETAFRVRLSRSAANLGVAVISQDPGVHIETRIVVQRDENRLTGRAALPLVTNPYLEDFGACSPTSAALLPEPGEYTIVFDSASRSTAGNFTFRWWIDDVTPPRIQLLEDRGRVLSARVTDSGAGVDPASISYSIDGGRPRRPTFDSQSGIATIELRNAKSGEHLLEVRASDYQEAKNTENVPNILPNTRILRAAMILS